MNRISDPAQSLRYRGVWILIGWGLVAYTVYASLSTSPPEGPGWLSDKMAHGLTYFVLAAWFAALYPPGNYPMIGAGLLVLGIALEFLQARTGYRYAELADALANLAGIMTGLAFGWASRGRWLAWFDQRLAATLP